MYVAITAITETGELIYCVNPEKKTTNVKEAFWWRTEQEARRVLREAREVYGLNAFPIELVQENTVISEFKPKPQEIKMVG
jgi:hypothetical protein